MEENQPVKKGFINKALDFIEKKGNKLPDPAILFFSLMIGIWIISALLSNVAFDVIDPRSQAPIQVINLLSGTSLAAFLSNMVTTFTGFAPLGIVLVAMLGVGVAEHAGFINAGLKSMLSVTPKALLTPMLILVAIVSHTATDAGYVLVIPLGGVIFYAAGRHPLSGIAAAFAGVSGGFSANFVPSGIDPLLQGFTQSAAQIINPAIELNPLNNWFFTSASTLLIVAIGWYITDKIVEPRLKSVAVEVNADEQPTMDRLLPKEKKAFWAACLVMVICLLALFLWAAPADSALRAESGDLAALSAPLMRSIVPLIFIIFLIPGVVYGLMSGTFKKSKDIIDSMTKSMSGMSYYIVMAFFCALFIDAFTKSNLGALLAIKGASGLKALALAPEITIVGIILLTAFVNLFIGSASAKWALLAPIMVPMLMQLGISPDLTQASYRVGDSVSNIVTPLMPYFPLVVVYCQKYVKSTGIGTLVSMMIPYSIAFMVLWTIFLLIYWALGIPLGLQSSYEYIAP
ncbi:AbgT family transporter [Flavobacterium lacus]|uniref:Para-aminobenzoyl-glutamate transporter family n=1 Tax=Flavobacterium lacus TaxID=1353778 RepID=A0A328WRV8_9FLAO|nr:AbgT family transporter [Flavobacterium lacus]RAR49080.1 para-aminobenzoyl-glutamate transporter family [Flavobacterium lacus]